MVTQWAKNLSFEDSPPWRFLSINSGKDGDQDQDINIDKCSNTINNTADQLNKHVLVQLRSYASITFRREI